MQDNDFLPYRLDDEIVTFCPECHGLADLRRLEQHGVNNPYRILYYICRYCGYRWAQCPYCNAIATQEDGHRQRAIVAEEDNLLGFTVLVRWRCVANISHFWTAEDENITPEDIFGNLPDPE